MVKEDLVRYRTRIREPIEGRLPNLGLNMYSPEPPSSGVVLQYILRLLDGESTLHSKDVLKWAKNIYMCIGKRTIFTSWYIAFYYIDVHTNYEDTVELYNYSYSLKGDVLQ